MCLYKITERYDPPLSRVFAWKVFILSGEVLYPEFRGGKPYEVNKWCEAQGGVIYADMPRLAKYQAGFHAFIEKEAAAYWFDSNYQVVRKVELEKVHTCGFQTALDLEVYVACRMRILPEEEEK